jgi:hypothetical protein
MKAILNEDIILQFSQTPVAVEVGRVPKGVGMERLRFNGHRVVDLMDLAVIYVRPIGPSFELHAVQVLGSQAVNMSYTDRGRLFKEKNGMIRILNEDEQDARKIQELLSQLKARHRSSLKSKVSDEKDMLADAFKLIFLLIVYSRNPYPMIGNFFDQLIPIIKDIYDLAGFKDDMLDLMTKLKTKQIKYNEKKQNIVGG